MVMTHDDDDDDDEKRRFDMFATMLLSFGDDDEIRARRVQEEEDGNLLMVCRTILLGKRKTESKNQEKNASSSSSCLVECKRRRVVVSDDEAKPIREIKPPVRERKPKDSVKRKPGVTPGWLVELMRRKKGVDAKMVIEKVITKTDLKPHQGRFLIPFKQITNEDFLNEEELRIVEDYHSTGDGEKGVDVILLNSNHVEKQWNGNLRIWMMKSSLNYALCSGWNLFVRENDLEVNQTRRLWSFHSPDGKKLFLAFNPKPHAASMAMDVIISEDPFVCEETNRRLYPFPKRRRTNYSSLCSDHNKRFLQPPK